jgi:lipoate-protein ligase A
MPDVPALLILPHRRAPGAAQMALDAALLSWASAGADRAAFRTYAWSRPTLSLGRAEPFPEGWDPDAILGAGIDVVRRPTGGDAVLHDTELTFSVAAALPGPWGLGPRGFADLVADALASALRASGLRAERAAAAAAGAWAGAGAGAGGGAARPGRRPCVAGTAPGEVRVGRF